MICSFVERMFEDYRDPPTSSSCLVPGFQIAHAGERDELFKLVRRLPGDRFEQESDVVSEVEAVQHTADEPARRVVENRQSLRARPPFTAGELVDTVACL